MKQLNKSKMTIITIPLATLREIREAIKYVVPHYKVYGITTFSDKLENALTLIDNLIAGGSLRAREKLKQLDLE